MDLRINSDELRKLGGNIQSLVSEYTVELRSIYIAVDETSNQWQGEDNTAYVSKINEGKENMTNLGKTIENYGTFLIETANDMDSTQDSIVQSLK